MKNNQYRYTGVLIAIVLLLAGRSQAQQMQPVMKDKYQLAQAIAERMKDTLELSGVQQERLYRINLRLAEQKIAVRGRYAHTDSLTIYIQAIENTRDSLYRHVLGPNRFPLYLQKKTQLIRN